MSTAVTPAGTCTRRNSNPNRAALEQGVAALEGGEAACGIRQRYGRSHGPLPVARTRRPYSRSRGRLLRNDAPVTGLFCRLGTARRFRRYERHRHGGKSAAKRDEACLGRNTVQSAFEDRGFGCDRRNCAYDRRPVRLRQYLGAGHSETVRPRARSYSSLDDQVPSAVIATCLAVFLLPKRRTRSSSAFRRFNIVAALSPRRSIAG